jgi:hypothetical protein
MQNDICGGEIPPLEFVYESYRLFFEDNPEAKCGIRSPHPEEWPGVPANVLDRMCVVVTQLAPNIRGRQLVNMLLWMTA